MKEFFEKFGLNEIFSHFFPGVIAMFAVVVWGIPEPKDFLGEQLGKNDFVLGLGAFVVAYASGVIISMAAIFFAHGAAANRPAWLGSPWTADLLFPFQWLRWFVARCIGGLPPPSQSMVFAYNREIPGAIEPIIGVDFMSLLVKPMDRCSILRSVALDRLSTKVTAMVQEADTYRRRFLFSLGAALALVLLGLSALARLAVIFLGKSPWKLPWTFLVDIGQWGTHLHVFPAWGLAITSLLAFTLSWQLRNVAARCWEQELAHSLAIVKLYGNYLP